MVHRVSTAYNLHANLRAKSAVRSMKHSESENRGPRGNLETDRMAMTSLVYRNTPDRNIGRSPAQVLHSLQLPDDVPCDPNRLRIIKE